MDYVGNPGYDIILSKAMTARTRWGRMRPVKVELNEALAKRFLQKIGRYTDYNVNIMDVNGNIIAASRNVERIGTFHEVAYRMVEGNVESMVICKENEYEKYFRRFMQYNRDFYGYQNETAYFSRDIHGYKLIIMATEADSKVQAYHSPEQLAWLKSELAEAAAAGKPAFVFNHNPIDGKFQHKWPGADVGPQGAELDSILHSCSTQVFYFSGHLHMGIYENGNGLTQEDNVVYVNVPGFGEECLYGDLIDAGMGWQMEVYDDRVVLRLRNFAESRWVDGYTYTYALTQ